MGKILVVDDEESMRRLIRLNLAPPHQIVDTGDPEEALAMALENKPDIILLDLRMPKYSGFDLCQTFTTFGSTQLIPVFVISGEAGLKTKEICRKLGAVAYFEKPVDFPALLASVADCLKTRRKERRSEVRVHLRVPLKLKGTDATGTAFQALTTTESVGPNSFLCACAQNLAIDSVVDVFLVGSPEEHAGNARIIRSENPGTEYPKYALRFVEKPAAWVLN